MISKINVSTVENVVRSFSGGQFTTEQFLFAMADQYPPVRRVQSSVASYIMRAYGLAEAQGRICVPILTSKRMTTVWKPLVGGF